MHVPLNAPTFGDEEILAATEVLKSLNLTMGARCFEFEAAFARYLGVKNAVFVNSGSSANLLAFFALTNPLLSERSQRKKFVPGSEVIVPAVTWSTTIWPIVQAGAIPVLVDSDPLTLQMDIQSVRNALSNKTVAIAPVHVLGNACEWAPLREIADQQRLWLVEDTCESLGTTHGTRFCGTRGDLGTYSFFFSHHITTMEGGMVVTDDDDLAEILRALRAHGWSRNLNNKQKWEAANPDIDPRFLFITTGFNVRPGEINAAFGLLQLKKLADFNQRRRQIAERWLTAFAAYQEQGLLQPMRVTPQTSATWFGFPFLCRDKEMRNRLRIHLESNGIETRPIIAGNMARQPAMKHVPHRVAGDLKGADEILHRGLFWGSHPLMSDTQVEYVIEQVKGFFKNDR